MDQLILRRCTKYSPISLRQKHPRGCHPSEAVLRRVPADYWTRERHRLEIACDYAATQAIQRAIPIQSTTAPVSNGETGGTHRECFLAQANVRSYLLCDRLFRFRLEL